VTSVVNMTDMNREDVFLIPIAILCLLSVYETENICYIC